MLNVNISNELIFLLFMELIFTFISLYRLLKNHQGGHIYKQTKNLHTVGVQTAERRRRLQRPIRLARFMFFDVKFGLRHVA